MQERTKVAKIRSCPFFRDPIYDLKRRQSNIWGLGQLEEIPRRHARKPQILDCGKVRWYFFWDRVSKKQARPPWVQVIITPAINYIQIVIPAPRFHGGRLREAESRNPGLPSGRFLVSGEDSGMPSLNPKHWNLLRGVQIGQTCKKSINSRHFRHSSSL